MRTRPGDAPAPTAASRAASFASFQYVGSTALTVFGAASGTRYRFTAPGAIVRVDARDAASMSAVPNLRPVARG